MTNGSPKANRLTDLFLKSTHVQHARFMVDLRATYSRRGAVAGRRPDTK